MGDAFIAAGRWCLPLRLTIETSSDNVPATTAWFARVEADYPLGLIKINPAQDGGLHATFNHMGRNAATEHPWRSGAPCLERPGRWLSHRATVNEPTAPAERMREYVLRALEWLRAAAAGELCDPNEPFELPGFPTEYPTYGFDEDSERFAIWTRHLSAVGTASVAELNSKTMVIRDFFLHEKPAHDSRWGTNISELEKTTTAHWITVPAIPVVRPYDVPLTWGQLRSVVNAAGGGLDGKLRWIYNQLHEAQKTDPTVLLIGFPIPLVPDGPSVQLHWQPLRLPAPVYVDAKVVKARGGSARSAAAWTFERNGPLADSKALEWLDSDNWSESALAVRGALCEPLRRARVVVIGAGALGSIVADLLVRAGVNTLIVCDWDDFEVGNVRRHVLTMGFAGYDKAMSLSIRLNGVSPFARVTYAGFFPILGTHRDDVANSDVVIDCSANDDVASRMTSFAWNPANERWYFSLSTGAHARKLFYYGMRGKLFDAADFASQLAPHLPAERTAFLETDPFLMSGSGCWNPVFPARYDSVVALAADAVRLIDTAISGTPHGEGFRAIERPAL